MSLLHRRSAVIKKMAPKILAVGCICSLCTATAVFGAGNPGPGVMTQQFQTGSAELPGKAVEVYTIGSGDSLCRPSGIWMEEDGSFLVADSRNHVIWRTQNQGYSILAGSLAKEGCAGGPISEALFRGPWSVIPFEGGYAVSDSKNGSVRLIKDGEVRTLAGKNGELSDLLQNPTGLATDGKGTLFIADTDSSLIIKLEPDGSASALSFGFNEPTGLCWKDGKLYIADSGNGRVSVVTGLSEGMAELTVISGSGGGPGNRSGFRDGPADQALFSNPQGVAVSGDGTIYVADTGNGAVRKIKEGTVTTILKMDGQEPWLYPASPRSLALRDGSLFISDVFTNTILKLSLE